MVIFRDLPEAITQGESIEECLLEASDCLEETIAARIDHRREIPISSEPQTQEHLVAVPLQMALKAVLFTAIKESGLPNTRIGELLNWSRMLIVYHDTSS